MSAKMMMNQTQADDGFGLLKDIVAMVKNPKAIDEAYEQRRKAVALNEEEIKKAEDARSLIAKADSLRAELRLEKDAITNAREEHEKGMKLHAEHVAAENKRLSDWETSLNNEKNTHAENVKKHTESVAALVAEEKRIKDSHAEWEVKAKEKEDAQKAVDVAQKAEAERLAEVAKKQKEKAARLAKEAAKDD